MLQPLDYIGHGIPEDLGEALIKAVPGVKAQPVPCETSSLGPAPACQLRAVPAVQAAADGSRTQNMGTLSWMLPIAAEKPPGLESLSIYFYIPCKVWVLLRFLPSSSLLGVMSLPWSWICSQFDRGENLKEKEWECVGMVCFSQHISLSIEAGGKPHQSKELRTRGHL